MKLTIIICFTFFVSTFSFSQFFHSAGSFNGSNVVIAKAIANDVYGNVFIAGWVRGSADFDPGPGVYELTSEWVHLNNDVFVTKLNSEGKLIWAKRIGNKFESVIEGIDVDINGNILLIGTFYGTLDFDSGVELVAKGSNDVFFLKLDSNGNFVWAKNLGSKYNDYGCKIKSDINGDIYLTSTYSGTIEFSKGLGLDSLTPLGDGDICILKISKNGDIKWAKSFGGMNDDYLEDMCLDPFGNILLTGYFTGTTDFDPSAGIFEITSFGYEDAYISKLNSNGDFIWAVQLGGSYNSDRGYGITTDKKGNVFVTGSFFETADFDPSPGKYELTSFNGSEDMYICKLDQNANLMWAIAIGAGSNDVGYSVTTDSLGNIYSAGKFAGIVDFNPGPKVNNLESFLGSTDIFVSKFNRYGDYLWAASMGGSYYDEGVDVLTNPDGKVYTTGTYRGSADFNPSNNVFKLTSKDNTIASFISILYQNITGSVRQSENTYGVNVYRNLGNESFNVSFINPGSYTLLLYNIEGKEIFRKKATLSTSFSFKIEEGPGLYFLKVIGESQNQTFKIINLNICN